MKKLIVGLSLLALVGCGDGISAREETCLENGGSWSECTSDKDYHNRKMAEIEAQVNRPYPPAVQGESYSNHYGDPAHGYWSNGQYHFNDPMSVAAQQTNSFLLAAGMGGLAGYMAGKMSSESEWRRSNPSGYTKVVKVSNITVDRSGKTISVAEAKRRQEQSKRDIKAHYEKKLAQQKESANKQKSNLTKKPDLVKKPVVTTKPTVQPQVAVKQKPQVKVTKKTQTYKKTFSKPSKPKVYKSKIYSKKKR